MTKRGVPILYMALLKAVYGTLKVALLFYQKLLGELEAVGVKVNLYDPCVTNKDIDRSEMTVCWHVDDLKVAHVDNQKQKKEIYLEANQVPGWYLLRGDNYRRKSA